MTDASVHDSRVFEEILDEDNSGGGVWAPVWVPDKRQEAMRDLVRLREDVKDRERKIRQQLNNYLQRHGFIWCSRVKAPRRLPWPSRGN